MTKERNEDRVLDLAVGALRADAPDPSDTSAALARVGRRLDAASRESAVLRSCEDFRSLFGRLEAGTLPEGRRWLLERHLGECRECRHRRAAGPAREASTETRAVPGRRSRSLRPMLAVAASIVVALSAGWLTQGWMPQALSAPAEIAALDGTVLRVADAAARPARSGSVFRAGERLRSAATSGAVVALPDGSLVELAPSSELSWRSGWRNTTLELASGRIIVKAAPQGFRRLFVRTDDCSVEVKGTVFSVTSATMGSRVSVIEGEVRVDRGGSTELLLAGQQLTTDDRMARVPLTEEIAWSRNVDEHLALVRELVELGRELDRVPRPGLRYSSRLVGLVPDSAVIVAAIPNFGGTVAESWQVFRERVATSEALGRWWDSNVVEAGAEPALEAAIERLREFGEVLGDEIVVAVGDPAGEDGPDLLVLAESRDDEVLGALLHAGLADSARPGGADDEDRGPTATGLSLSVEGGLLVAASKPRLIGEVARVRAGASAGLTDTRLHSLLQESYRDGAGWLIAADVERLLASSRTGTDDDVRLLELLGISDARHLIASRRRIGRTTLNEAVLHFDGARSGVASFVSSPKPLSALEFVSADAHAAAAIAFEPPGETLRALLGSIDGGAGEIEASLNELRDTTGIDFLRDIVDPLGGELAIALDGPVLPSPAWRLIVEVWDEAALQRSIDALVAEANARLAAEGRPTASLRRSQASGRPAWSLDVPESPISISWAYDGGFMIVAPEATLVARAIATRESGFGLTDASEFRELLPADGPDDFSALLYQNAGRLLGPLAGLGRATTALTPEQSRMLEEIAEAQQASLTVVWAGTDTVSLASTGNGPLGGEIGALLGLGSLASLGNDPGVGSQPGDSGSTSR
jgi:ferric-dicitrate binding protein FerR (iron transport regulator)